MTSSDDLGVALDALVTVTNHDQMFAVFRQHPILLSDEAGRLLSASEMDADYVATLQAVLDAARAIWFAEQNESNIEELTFRLDGMDVDHPEHFALVRALGAAYMNRGKARLASRAHGVDGAIKDFDTAIELMEVLPRNLGHTKGHIELRNDLAGVYMNRGNARRASRAHGVEAAIKDFDAAISLREALRRDLGDAWNGYTGLRNNQAGVYMNRGIARFASRTHGVEAAIEDFDRAIELREALRSDLGNGWNEQIELRNDLARAYMNRGNVRRVSRAHGVDAAIADYDTAIELMEALRQGLGRSWDGHSGLCNDLAAGYTNRGIARWESRAHGVEAAIKDFDIGIELREALRRDLGDAWNGQIELRRELATVYMSRGGARRMIRGHGVDAGIADFDTAIELMQALRRDLGPAWDEQTELRNDLAGVYTNRGNARSRAHGLDTAIKDYDAAIELMQALRRDLGPAWNGHTELRNDLAKIYMNRGIARQAGGAHGVDAPIEDFDAAIELRLALRRDLGDAWNEQIELRNGLAEVYMNRGIARMASRAHGVDAAIADFGEAIEIFKTVKSDVGAWRSHVLLVRTYAHTARCQAQLHHWNEAWVACGNAFDCLDDEFDAAIALSERREALQELRGLASLAAFAAIRGGSYSEAVVQAFELLDRGRAIQLREALDLDEATVARRLPDWLAEFQSHKSRLQQIRLLLEQPSIEDRVAIYREAQDVHERLKVVLAEARGGSGRVSGLDLIAGSVPAYGALIAPVITEHGSSVLIAAKDRDGVLQTFAIDLRKVEQAVLEDRLDRWLSAYSLDRRTADVTSLETLEELTAWLGEVIMGPVVDYLSNEVGLRPAIEDEALAPELVIVATGTLSFLPFQAARLPSGKTVLDGYAVSYTPSCDAFKAAHERAEAREALTANIIAAIDPDGSLPGAGIERRVLEKLFAPAERAIFSGSAATRAAILSQAGQFTHHHYSCHGEFVPGNATQSALKLADEPLTVREILSAPGLCDRCRLAVMSACETGMTDLAHLPDEGMGLVMAYMYAGASAVLATQWVVGDHDAAFVIGQLYELLLGDNGGLSRLSPAQALRLVMLDLRGSRLRTGGAQEISATLEPLRKGNLIELRRPLAWAPFVIWGA
jgi:tetratricopeptide (TPR) repeat protein